MSRQRNPSTLSQRDEDDLIWYAQQLCYLSIHACGTELGSSGGEPPTTPRWMKSFAAESEPALARSIWWRLQCASAQYKPAATVLLALHDPAAIVCDGKTSLTDEELERVKRDPTFRVREKLDVGRRLAVYPCTWTADEARRWRDEAPGRIAADQMARGLSTFIRGKRKGGRQPVHPLDGLAQYLALNGERPIARLGLIAEEKRRAKGEVSATWREIDVEATVLIEASVRAWNDEPDHRAKVPRMITGKIGGAR